MRFALILAVLPSIAFAANPSPDFYNVTVDNKLILSRAQSVPPATLTLTANTATPNFALANSFSLSLNHSTCPCVIANPTSATVGQSGVIVITQSSAGNDVVTFGSQYKFPGGAAPTPTSGANAVDVVTYYVAGSSIVLATFIGDFR